MDWVHLLHAVAGPRALAEADAALDQAWLIYPHVPAAIRMQMGIAVGEIVANIVEHGSAGRHLVQLEMLIALGPKTVSICLRDDGNESATDLHTVQMPDFDAERGRGLALARSALGELSYQREGGSNHWLLTSTTF